MICLRSEVSFLSARDYEYSVENAGILELRECNRIKFDSVTELWLGTRNICLFYELIWLVF